MSEARATRVRTLEQARRVLPGLQHHRCLDTGGGGSQGGRCIEGMCSKSNAFI